LICASDMRRDRRSSKTIGPGSQFFSRLPAQAALQQAESAEDRCGSRAAVKMACRPRTVYPQQGTKAPSVVGLHSHRQSKPILTPTFCPTSTGCANASRPIGPRSRTLPSNSSSIGHSRRDRPAQARPLDRNALEAYVIRTRAVGWPPALCPPARRHRFGWFATAGPGGHPAWILFSVYAVADHPSLTNCFCHSSSVMGRSEMT
jgi:hypothetical protein